MNQRLLKLEFITEHQLAEDFSYFLAAIGSEGITTVDKQEFIDMLAELAINDVVVEEYLSDLTDEVTIEAFFPATADQALLDFEQGKNDDPNKIKVRINRERQYSGEIYDNAPKRWTDLAELQKILHKEIELLTEAGQKKLELKAISVVAEEDWAENWKQYYTTNHVSQHLVINPTWLEYEAKPEEVVINLDPGSAFGTGTHETTCLCLRELDARTYLPGQKILDLGTGSGILAIAIAKLQQRLGIVSELEAIDIDERVVEVAKENFASNDVQITAYAGQLRDAKQEKYDLIVANLVAKILIPLATDFYNKLSLTGELLISGIIADKLAEVKQAMSKAGFSLKREVSENGWYALTYCKQAQNELSATTQRGRFITLEGIDGVGKTTQLQAISDFLTQQGIEFQILREPGGTQIGEQIREILLHKKNNQMSALTELLLFSAARAQLANEVLLPSLQKGTWIICDRFFDSTIAYQGYGREMDKQLVRTVCLSEETDLTPDLTLLLDLEVDSAMRRSHDRGEVDRIDAEDQAFMQRVRQGFLDQAQQQPQRIKIVDANQPIAEVTEQIKRHLQDLLVAESQ